MIESPQTTFATLPFSWLLIRLCQWIVVIRDEGAGRQEKGFMSASISRVFSPTAAHISGVSAGKCILEWKD